MGIPSETCPELRRARSLLCGINIDAYPRKKIAPLNLTKELFMTQFCHKQEGVVDYLQFIDFRNYTNDYFDKVENGDVFVIIRKGKPIAKLLPF